ncbi:hypothetical protein CPI83_29830 (plasmid) [Rhodococcus sp. H-CA8f]|uniref:RNA-directed DNA polymerase n=1 Tax=Rhodococcus sp. H-CA8f TaxID=1727214 RepID=UPI000BE3990D|nr:RNA-directed DNA polymerase [Rhodococcus sp. H-CA8f]ATI36400.1 hypothetical protein CPI83_29830 [Rhodococcus sp. H-CA8f]
MNRSDLLGELDFDDAVVKELDATTRLLPPSPVTAKLKFRGGKVAELIRDELARGVQAKPASVVLAPKVRGARPLNQWRLQDRVLYRALVERLRLQLPIELQGRRPHSEFEAAPYENQDNKYICSTDITAYYQYIDHDVLADELTAQTGDYHTVSALIGLLEQVMGTRVGIPQVHAASDILGDTYIDPIRRTLIREGFDAYVYADDFRIGCTSLGQARASLELCANAARSLGLVLNDSKTRTYKRETYASTLKPLSAAATALLEEMDLNRAAEFLMGGEYEDLGEPAPLAPDFRRFADSTPGADDAESVTAPEFDEEDSTLILGVWEAWASNPDRHTDEFFRRFLGQALPGLGLLGENGPLEEVPTLLETAPHLTPQLAEYLRNLAAPGSFLADRTRAVVYSGVRSDRLSEWQKVWLAYVLGSPSALRPQAKRLAPDPSQIVAWLEECVQDESSDVLAAAAAEALGRLHMGSTAILKKAYGRIAPEFRLSVLWALGSLDSEKAAEVAESKFDRLVLSDPQ